MLKVHDRITEVHELRVLATAHLDLSDSYVAYTLLPVDPVDAELGHLPVCTHHWVMPGKRGSLRDVLRRSFGLARDTYNTKVPEKQVAQMPAFAMYTGKACTKGH